MHSSGHDTGLYSVPAGEILDDKVESFRVEGWLPQAERLQASTWLGRWVGTLVSTPGHRLSLSRGWTLISSGDLSPRSRLIQQHPHPPPHHSSAGHSLSLRRHVLHPFTVFLAFFLVYYSPSLVRMGTPRGQALTHLSVFELSVQGDLSVLNK